MPPFSAAGGHHYYSSGPITSGFGAYYPPNQPVISIAASSQVSSIGLPIVAPDPIERLSSIVMDQMSAMHDGGDPSRSEAATAGCIAKTGKAYGQGKVPKKLNPVLIQFSTTP